MDKESRLSSYYEEERVKVVTSYNSSICGSAYDRVMFLEAREKEMKGPTSVPLFSQAFLYSINIIINKERSQLLPNKLSYVLDKGNTAKDESMVQCMRLSAVAVTHTLP